MGEDGAKKVLFVTVGTILASFWEWRPTQPQNKKPSLPLLGLWINFTWEFELVILLKAQFHFAFCRWTCNVICVLFHVWFKHKATLML